MSGRGQEGARREGLGLDEAETVLAGLPVAGERDSAIDLLQLLAVLEPPDPAKVAEAVRALKDAAMRQTAAAQIVTRRPNSYRRPAQYR